MDNNANFVEEEQVLEELEKASNYEHAVAHFNTAQKSMVKMLRDAVGDIGKSLKVTNKCKSLFLESDSEKLSLLTSVTGPAIFTMEESENGPARKKKSIEPAPIDKQN